MITLHKTIRFGPELSLLSCVRLAKRFVLTLRAIGGDPADERAELLALLDKTTPEEVR